MQPFVLLAALIILAALLIARGLVPGPVKAIRIAVGETKAIESPLTPANVRVLKDTRSLEARVVNGRVEIEARARIVTDMVVDWTNGKRDRFVVVVGAPKTSLIVRAPSRPSRVDRPRVASNAAMQPVKPLDVTIAKKADPREPPVKLVDVKKPDEKKDDTKPDGQVVELPRPLEERRPEKSKYVSEYDSSVAKEMKSRNRKLPPSPMPMSVESAPPVRARPPVEKKMALAGKPGPKTDGREKVDEKKAFEPAERNAPERRRYSLLDRKLQLDPSGTVPRFDDSATEKGAPSRARREEGRAKEDAREATGDEGQDGTGRRDLKDLMPSRETLRSIAGGPVNDYLKGVDEGDRDMLNSRSWKYATFFNRVKRGVAQHWKPAGAYLRRDPNGNIYGVKDRYTVLHVTLSGGGELKDLRVHQTCGVDFLDGEAIQAFKDAQPFPNPPMGLRDPKGHVAFLFGFYFEISSRPQFRIFRYNN